MQPNAQVLIVPFFKTIAMPDPVRSKEEGRPCFKNQEFVEVRIAGERNYLPCFPALSMWERQNGVEVTYAERWPEQYRRFKENEEQVADGTPLAELPFLDQAKRAELKALKVYTGEALAALEGKNLKALGMDGNTLKQQAIGYLESAKGSAGFTRLAAENEQMRNELAELRKLVVTGQSATPDVEPAVATKTSYGFADWDDEALKEHIAEKAGSRPRGNPNHDTLVNMAESLQDVAA